MRATQVRRTDQHDTEDVSTPQRDAEADAAVEAADDTLDDIDALLDEVDEAIDGMGSHEAERAYEAMFARAIIVGFCGCSGGYRERA